MIACTICVTLQAIYGDERVHAEFLARFGLGSHTHPRLELDTNNWEQPFRAAGTRGPAGLPLCLPSMCLPSCRCR